MAVLFPSGNCIDCGHVTDRIVQDHKGRAVSLCLQCAIARLQPTVRGGQGRTDREIEQSGGWLIAAFLFTLLAVGGLVIWRILA